MGHFRSNLRDIEFNLFEVFRVQEHLGSGPFEGVDIDVARDTLRELNTVATGPLAASFADADRHPPVFDPATHSVTLPQSLKDAYRCCGTASGGGSGLPVELGGYGVPPSVQWAAAELILGANPAAFMYMSGPSFAAIVHRNGTPEQQRWAELMIDRGWGATMVLTEPDAGSDVGAGRTKAVRQDDGSWHLEGVKRFITSADQDITENIMHMVLARPEGPASPSRAPRACRCSSCPSSTSTRRPASRASATACSSPTSSTRWASRPPPPASSRSASTACPAVG